MIQDTTYDSMNLNKVTLAFSKENESLFLKKYFSDSIFQFRVAFILVTLLYGSFGYLDMQVIPEYATTFHAIRFLFVMPILVIVFILSFTQLFQKVWQLLLLISFIVGGLGISLMILLAPENYAYFGGMMLVFFAGYFFIKLRFFLATIAGWSILIVYNIGAIFYAQVPQEILITNNFFFVSANIIGMFAAYNIEYYIRRNFFLNKKYDLERLAVIDANKSLEKTVEERTKELILAKEKAEESERKLIEAQALSHVGSWEYIIDTDTITWSKELFNIFERPYDLPAPQYSEQQQHYTEESFAILDKAVQDCVQRDIPYEIELDIITSSGAVKRIISKGRSIKDKNNKIIGSYGTAQDITEKKKAELEIKESEERYKILSEATIEGLCVHDKGIVSDVNDRLVEFLGYPKDELIGMNILNLIADESKDIVRQHSTSDYDKPYEAVVLRKNNTTFPTILSGKQIPVNGKIHRIVSVRDVTDQKKYEQELIKAKEKAEESDRLKSAFLANMSHEIRTPMNGILGFTNLLQRPNLSGKQQQKYIDIIQKSGSRMLSTVNDIVDISKIESGLVNIKVSEVNISEQMKYLHSFFTPEAAQKGIKLIFKKGLSEKDIKIKTDFEKFNSIVTNLIKNAIKFTDQGSIELGYRTLNENGKSKIEFHVKDTGIGIPKHRQEAIFDRFIQADIEDKQAKQGSGLGLAISKAYAEMLGGKMWVDSQEGKGTTFYFTIETFATS